MILLANSGGTPRAPRTIAVFGAGLIGSAVVETLTSRASLQGETIPLSWADPALQARQLQEIEERIAAMFARSWGTETPSCSSEGASLAVFWSAGQAGFTATEADTMGEQSSFRAVLSMAERLARRFPEVRTLFYLISSAGGLFEGQRHVDKGAIPTPRRPYGLLKWQQEQLLLASDAPVLKRIYRLTSVYGYLRPHQRTGLISTLLLNGVRHKTSTITGLMSTLRDFIFAGDIAGFLAHALLEDDGRPQESVQLLSGGKPSSLFEIQKMVEAVIRRKIYVSYSLQPSNSADITFSLSAPPGWFPSDLRSSIGEIYREAFATGVLFEALLERP